MGLRLSEGVALERLKQIDANSLRTDRLDQLVELGLVEVSDTILRTTDAGRPVLNAVLRDLLA